MPQLKPMDFPQNRKIKKKTRACDRINIGKKGRVYSRGSKLWVDFNYLGQRCREPTGLNNTASNRAEIRRTAFILNSAESGSFVFCLTSEHLLLPIYIGLFEVSTNLG